MASGFASVNEENILSMNSAYYSTCVVHTKTILFISVSVHIHHYLPTLRRIIVDNITWQGGDT